MDKNIELVELAKTGDEDAYNQLLNNHKNMIYKIINTQNLYSGDYMQDVDSLYQEGCIALYNAIYKYEKDKGMSFTSFAYMVIRSRISTCIRDTKALKETCISIDNYPNIDHQIMMSAMYVAENPVEYHRQVDFENRLNEFVANLNSQDRQIFTLRKNEYSYKEISEMLHINTKRVDNRLRIIRKKLREYIK